MYNKVILVGKLSKTLTTKQLNSYNIGLLTITVERKKETQNGIVEEQHDIECSFFGKLIEEASKFQLNETIIIEGRLRTSKGISKTTGNEFSWLSVIAEKIMPIEMPLMNLNVEEQRRPVVFNNPNIDNDLPF